MSKSNAATAVPSAPVAPTQDAVFVAGRWLVSREYAARLIGCKPTTLATALGRGEIKLTRYSRAHGAWFELAEVEALVLSRVFRPGQRMRAKPSKAKPPRAA